MKFPVKVPFKYDQHGEVKCIVDYIRKNNLNIPQKYIDIGASDGVCNSNSRYFAHQGTWEVHLFEPCPVNFRLLETNTHPTWGNSIYNYAVGNKNGKVKFKSEGGLSKIDQKGGIEVEMITVKKMFEKPLWNVKKDSIGILDVDTEGGEEGILLQFMKLEVYPHFIIVEHQNNNPKIQEQERILSPKYKRIARKGVNDIWHLK